MVHSLPHRIFKYSGHLSYIFTVFELKSLDKLKHPYQKIPQLIQIILSNNKFFLNTKCKEINNSQGMLQKFARKIYEIIFV